MEKVIDVKNPKEVIEYLNKVDVDEYIEIYFGRVHVEGRLMHHDDGYVRLINDGYGIIEIDVNEILDNLLELVHTKENERIILRFY